MDLACVNCGHDWPTHSSNPTTATCQGDGCKCQTFDPESDKKQKFRESFHRFVQEEMEEVNRHWQKYQEKQSKHDAFWSRVYSIAVHEKCGGDLKEVGHGTHTQWEMDNIPRKSVFKDFVIWKCLGCGAMFDSDSIGEKWTYRFEHRDNFNEDN